MTQDPWVILRVYPWVTQTHHRAGLGICEYEYGLEFLTMGYPGSWLSRSAQRHHPVCAQGQIQVVFVC